MNDSGDILHAKRWHLVVPLVLLQLWPWYIVWKAHWWVPRFEMIILDLLEGLHLPAITQFALNTYQYWIVVPILTTALCGLCFSKRVKNIGIPVLVMVLTILSSVALSWLLTEAAVCPLRKAIERLGSQYHGLL